MYCKLFVITKREGFGSNCILALFVSLEIHSNILFNDLKLWLNFTRFKKLPVLLDRLNGLNNRNLFSHSLEARCSRSRF